MIPEQTTAFRVYKEGGPLLGIATVESPEVSFITETISGSGIAGEYESPAIGMPSSMSMTFNFTSRSKDFYLLQDISENNSVELRANIQVADETTGLKKFVPCRLVITYMTKTASGGSFETGKKQGNSVEVEVLRHLEELDGKEVLLIDKLAMIYRINGKDMLAGVRKNLGMDF
ncbi:MAG: phage major tail tube protein [Deltaproteobacteria bacterium]|jgi:P2 family phage contractile tail tube protein|nr:phage major tail tube protein [Deltaproteobacteria bacterium]